jgi:hypothetical protein
MRSQHPPRLATRLLTRLAPNEPLDGDLQEEYRAGRSAAWYWRQVLAAIAQSSLRRGDLHQLFAPQSMTMQLVMLALVSVCAVFTVKMVLLMLIDEQVRRLLIGPVGLRETLRLVASFVVAAPLGVAIARLHVRSQHAAVVAFSLAVAAWAFANVLLLNGHGDLNAALPHVAGMLVFIAGLLIGGLHDTTHSIRHELN